MRTPEVGPEAAEGPGTGTGAGPESVDPRRWWVLSVLSLALFMIILNNGLLNVAIPSIMRDLGTGITRTQWIVDGYALVFAACLLTAGTLSDRYGRKRGTLLGALVFGAGSLVAVTADGAAQLTLARGLMGMAAAFVMPGTLSILVDVFPAHERPRAIAVWGSASALGVAAGPILGGVLVDHFWWGSVFFVNLLPVAVVLVAGAALLPESAARVPRPPDPVGALLGSATMTGLVYGVIHASGSGWTSASVLSAFAVAGASAGAFVAWERRHPSPMVDFAMLRRRAFQGAGTGNTMLFLGLAGTLFVLTQQMQFVMGYTPLEAGLAVAPFAAAVGVGSAVAPALARSTGPRGGVAAGLACAATGMLVLTRSAEGYPVLLCGVALCGAGVGLALTPATDTMMRLVPGDRAGNAAALNNTTQELGNALGVAVLGTVLAHQYTHGPSGEMRPPTTAAARDAFEHAASTGFAVAAALVAAGAAAAAFLLPGPRPAGPAPAPGRAEKPPAPEESRAPTR
ncbi:MFS transporter [Streptomyces albiaxialis]|uniref:MFS transporter n=1 Tax=Streptomyces albiaxialis TaxID=329523 RepID=A0ABN2VZ02_9ACTN